MSRLRTLRIVVPIALAALELSHPTFSEGGVAHAVVSAGGWWVALHLLLMAGHAVLVWLLWVPAVFPRIALSLFLVGNTAFLAVDGVGVGLLASTDPGAADQLWNSAFVTALANLTGATWAASLLSVAAWSTPAARTRPILLGLALTWLTFVATVPPLAAPSSLPRLAAAATGAWLVYLTGAAGMPPALLVFAAVLHQHVGPEAALGIVLVSGTLARLPKHG